eukprot:m.129250 g.129250  ORF g.129250 m.129250 type:complete len:347 (+) comp16754_c4_seq1:282-1322(+)
MSSLAAARADNFYFPPEWEPKHGSINKFQGQHPLRERARKLDQGILIIRFELPFNVWCGGCEAHIERGVRYNAEKKKIGNYYTTPIYSFQMKCHLCPNKFIIETDPKNCDYVVRSGARKKNEEWEPEDTETIRLQNTEQKERMVADPMYRLEHSQQDKLKAKERKGSLTRLMDLKTDYSDDYSHNSRLRARHRVKRRAVKRQEAADGRLAAKASLHIPLVAEAPEDVSKAKAITYGKKKLTADKHLAKQRRTFKRSSIFDGKHAKTQAGQAAAASSSTLVNTGPSLAKGNGASQQLRRSTRRQPARASSLIKPRSSGSSHGAAAAPTPAPKSGLVAYSDGSSDDDQ